MNTKLVSDIVEMNMNKVIFITENQLASIQMMLVDDNPDLTLSELGSVFSGSYSIHEYQDPNGYTREEASKLLRMSGW